MMPEQRQSCVLFGAGQVGGRAVAALLATGFARPIRLFGAETWPPSEPPPLLKRFLFDGMEPKALLLPGVPTMAESDVVAMLGRAAATIDRDRRLVRLADLDAIPTTLSSWRRRPGPAPLPSWTQTARRPCPPDNRGRRRDSHRRLADSAVLVRNLLGSPKAQ